MLTLKMNKNYKKNLRFFFPIIIYYVPTMYDSFCSCLGINKSEIVFVFKNL